MYLKSLELVGFKSFGKKSLIEFSSPITAIVGPNGSGKSNSAEAFRFVLGEQSIKSLRGKRGEDLIWGGSSEVPRSNRAAVKATFDNTKRLLNVDFDEVVIERVVFRDGTNEYLINGSKVRLKDVTELLAAANIGSTGHHIISQGEADRVLAATPRERRHMIEDALGLRAYHYKKDESLKKLEKTEENRAQVESLRRENAPHLKFLERQMKKMERARELREELVTRYAEYLKREELYLAYERDVLEEAQAAPKKELEQAQDRVNDLERSLQEKSARSEAHRQLSEVHRSVATLRAELAEHTRTVGRIEGQVSFEKRRIDTEKQKAHEEEGRPIPYREAKTFWDKLTAVLDGAVDSGEMGPLQSGLQEAQQLVRKFIERHHGATAEVEIDTRELERLEIELAAAENEVGRVEARLSELDGRARELQMEIDESKEALRDDERELYMERAKVTELTHQLADVAQRRVQLAREEEEFKREVSEGVVLIGRRVNEYHEFTLPPEVLDLNEPREPRDAQYERRRELEKLKVRLEELGGTQALDISKEYQETKERDEFLARELADLEASADSLRALIKDLERELGERFESGVAAIATQFNEYFMLMFGGGSAELKLQKAKKRGIVATLLGDEVPEDEQAGEEEELGVDIDVALPRKRVQNLMVLSGGERALTSIALIFAMSQVNPPPFLILDETDAALDEANSRRYGDLITRLSEKSQLILITHNRETMSRAGVLYGITMGADGVSRILSVKFDEATAVAK